jgi:hypothetical protein
MIAPLVIAAPNTWNGSVPTRWLALGLSPNEAPSGSTRSSTSPASVSRELSDAGLFVRQGARLRLTISFAARPDALMID